MLGVSSFIKMFLPTMLAALSVSTLALTPAAAHPGHSETAKMVMLEPEAAYTFDHENQSYTVWNTNMVNFFGLFRIEIRNEAGEVAMVWWERRGWCYTAEAFAEERCMPQARYLKYFSQRLANLSVGTTGFGRTGTGTRSSILDNYPCLEKRVSSNLAASVDMDPSDC